MTITDQETDTVADVEKKGPDRTIRVKNVVKDPSLLVERDHPVSHVEWVNPELLHANGYNPNRVFTPEMQLLKNHIIEIGWTQPIVVRKSSMEIVDGFHRWTLSLHDPEIRAVSGNKVPVVWFPDHLGEEVQMRSTINHNRARGVHGILSMSDIVQRLKALGTTDEQLREGLGMEQEEIERLAEVKGSPETAGRDSFGKGWIPKPNEFKFQRPKADGKRSGIRGARRAAEKPDADEPEKKEET